MAAVSLALMMTSCSDFLAETSQDEFEPKTAIAYQEILNGTGYTTTTTLDAFTDLLSDDAEGAKGMAYNYNDANNAHQALFTWQPDAYQTFSDAGIKTTLHSYSEFYKRIMTCNLVISGVNGTMGSELEKNQTMGEALALRAFYYWYLVNMYAMPYNTPGANPAQLPGVPLVTVAEMHDEGPARNSVAEVYAQITKDIEESCRLLETNKDFAVGLFRINHTAAHLIASRIYLHMENWDKVIEHATKGMESAPAICDLTTYTLSNKYAAANSNNQIISKNFPEVIFINGSRNGRILTEGTLMRVSDSLLSGYEANDARKAIYFQPNNYMYYLNWMAKFGLSEQGYVWRTAELYLNRAEAYAAKNLKGDAASGKKAEADLNALRAKRIKGYTPYQAASAQALMDFCRQERRLELCYEQHRWFDLRRYGMPELKHTWYDATGVCSEFTLKAKDAGYALPIPQNALDVNRNLQQNELAPKRVGVAK